MLILLMRLARSRFCLTPANIALAENNARLQFGSLLRSMGFDKTKVVFDNAKSVAQKEG